MLQRLAPLRRHPDRPLVAICPGSKMQANRWPVERFTQLSHRLQATNRFELLLIGGAGDIDLGRQVARGVPEAIDCCGQFHILESAAALSCCAFMIGLDTGTTHLAAAVDTPCIAIYGGRNLPGLWYPLGTQHIVLRHPVPCVGCSYMRCPLPDHPCITSISVDMVWSAVETMIVRYSAGTLDQSQVADDEAWGGCYKRNSAKGAADQCDC
jgi:ADP-heptose:LPS heptosyltransferase